jgi:hypothetical protein
MLRSAKLRRWVIDPETSLDAPRTVGIRGGRIASIAWTAELTIGPDYIAVVRLVADPSAAGFYARLGARHVGDRRAPMEGAADRVLPIMEFVFG